MESDGRIWFLFWRLGFIGSGCLVSRTSGTSFAGIFMEIFAEPSGLRALGFPLGADFKMVCAAFFCELFAGAVSCFKAALKTVLFCVSVFLGAGFFI